MSPKPLAIIGNFTAFFAAFILVCAGIGAVLPRPKVPIVTTKLDWLAEHGEDYDVFFFGSSRTFRQLLPEVFDKEMQEAGHRVRSFNAGVDGMRPPEDTYWMENVLAGRKVSLKLVLVECNPIRLRQREEDRDTAREVYWHDGARIGTLFRAAFLADEKKRPWSKRITKVADAWPDFSDHLGYWAWRNSNLGRGHELLSDWMGLRVSNGLLASDIGKRSDGYKPFTEAEPMNEVRVAEYQRGLAAQLGKPARNSTGDGVSTEEIRAKKRIIERAGGRMVLVIPPFIGENIFRPKPDDALPPVLDFSSPQKYPELFKVENRADAGHTNVAGSDLYTRLIVRELLPLLREGR